MADGSSANGFFCMIPVSKQGLVTRFNNTFIQFPFRLFKLP